MTQGLKRYYGSGYLHYITFSCHQRRPVLGVARRRDLFLSVLEQARRSYGFGVVAYGVMPEPVHLLISEPERGTPSTVLQVVKQRFAHKLLRDLRRRARPAQGRFWDFELEAGHIWQRRFYDLPIWNPKKRVQKVRYIHRNPVKRGLVLEPQQWKWSSYRACAFNEKGPVRVNEPRPAVMKVKAGSPLDERMRKAS